MMKSFVRSTTTSNKRKSAKRPANVPLPAPPPPEIIKQVEEELPEEDLASNREHFERIIPATASAVFDMFCTYVWRENAGVGGESVMQITKDAKTPGTALEEGMERTVYGFSEVVTRVSKPRIIEYKVKDVGSFHKSRVIFKSEPEDKTRVVWTIWWTPDSLVTSMVYTLGMKGFCNLALYRLEQNILTGNVEKMTSKMTITDQANGEDDVVDDDDNDEHTFDPSAGVLQDGQVAKLQWAARLQTGYEGNLTPDQEASLQLLRETLKNEDPEVWKLCQDHPDGPDRIMLRFLRAECNGKRKFNVPASRKRLAETLKFRRDMNVTELMTKDPPKFKEFVESGGELLICDREGRIGVFTRGGLLSTCLDTKMMTEDEWKRNLVCITERRMQILRDNSKKLGHEVSASVIVYDVRGLGLSSRKIIPFTKIINEVASKHYPEMVDVIYICHAPGLFAAIFSAMKSFLDPVTASKVQVFGTSTKEQDRMHRALRTIFDPKILPKEFGGDSETNFVGYPSGYHGPKFPT